MTPLGIILAETPRLAPEVKRFPLEPPLTSLQNGLEMTRPRKNKFTNKL